MISNSGAVRRPGLLRMCSGIAILPMSCRSEAALSACISAFVLHPERAREPQRVLLHPAHVIVRDVVLGVNRLRQRLDRRDVDLVHLAQVIDLILRAAEHVAQRHVEDDRQRRDEDERLERVVARQHQHQHRREHAAERRAPRAPGRCSRQIGRIGARRSKPMAIATIPLFNPKWTTPNDREQHDQAQRAERASHERVAPASVKKTWPADPRRDRQARHVEEHPVGGPLDVRHPERQHETVDRRRERASGRADDQCGDDAERVGDRIADRQPGKAQRRPACHDGEHDQGDPFPRERAGRQVPGGMGADAQTEKDCGAHEDGRWPSHPAGGHPVKLRDAAPRHPNRREGAELEMECPQRAG